MGTWRSLLTLACPATPKESYRGSVKQDSRQGECPGEGLPVGERGRGTCRTVKSTLAGDHLRGVMGKVLLLGDPAKRKDRRDPPGP